MNPYQISFLITEDLYNNGVKNTITFGDFTRILISGLFGNTLNETTVYGIDLPLISNRQALNIRKMITPIMDRLSRLTSRPEPDAIRETLLKAFTEVKVDGDTLQRFMLEAIYFNVKRTNPGLSKVQIQERTSEIFKMFLDNVISHITEHWEMFHEIEDQESEPEIKDADLEKVPQIKPDEPSLINLL